MPVYQPNAVVGNSRMLVTLGASAELMALFYPHIDFPQNLREGMPAVYFPPDDSRAGRLVWTFDPSWRSTQRYLGRTNIVETDLLHTDTGLTLRITDFVHPSEPMLVRRFQAANPTRAPIRTKLFQYLDLQLGEVQHKNAVHYHPDRKVASAYWRNICVAIGVETLDEYGCGRASPDSPNSCKRQMQQGTLNKQMEEIGDIDIALGWGLTLEPGESVAHLLIIAANSNERAAVARVEAARELGWEALHNWTTHASADHLSPARRPHIEPDLQDAYYRCLLAVDLLADPDTGSILAAPEFDPFFERSGGYGYCWPRDAVEAGLALEAAGYPGYLARFLRWAVAAQRPEGYWEQRYWLTGQRGPAWCTQEEALQIDQTASVLFAMGRHARRLPESERVHFLEDIWDSARRAAEYLVADLSPRTGLHTTAFDLWETFRGSFTYSNAAIASALREAAFLARLAHQEDAASAWDNAASSLKHAIISRLWQGDIFIRGLDPDGRPDSAADASALGLICPFGLLDLDDPAERAIAVTAVETLAKRAAGPAPDAETLRRFEGDQYAGGGPGAVTTLWLARVLLRLALASAHDPRAVAAYRTRAVASMRAVLKSATSTGLLPEMMGVGPHTGWAVPHAWAMASFVFAALLLDRLPGGPPGETT